MKKTKSQNKFVKLNDEYFQPPVDELDEKDLNSLFKYDKKM
jgi:hypothetical protein